VRASKTISFLTIEEHGSFRNVEEAVHILKQAEVGYVRLESFNQLAPTKGVRLCVARDASFIDQCIARISNVAD
jgi:aspartate/methionine/tyrosine aminotransferase